MVQRLLQVRAHLILCFRAEEKIEMVREPDEHGKMKTKVVPKQSLTGLHGWIPVCEKNLPYELTASFLLLASAPGIPQPIKLQEQHRALFPLDKPITEDSGKRLAAWAAGGQTPAAPASTAELCPVSPRDGKPDAAGPVKTRSETLREWCAQAGLNYVDLLSRAGVRSAEEMTDEDYAGAVAACRRRIDKRKAAETA